MFADPGNNLKYRVWRENGTLCCDIFEDSEDCFIIDYDYYNSQLNKRGAEALLKCYQNKGYKIEEFKNVEVQ